MVTTRARARQVQLEAPTGYQKDQPDISANNVPLVTTSAAGISTHKHWVGSEDSREKVCQQPLRLKPKQPRKSKGSSTTKSSTPNGAPPGTTTSKFPRAEIGYSIPVPSPPATPSTPKRPTRRPPTPTTPAKRASVKDEKLDEHVEEAIGKLMKLRLEEGKRKKLLASREQKEQQQGNHRRVYQLVTTSRPDLLNGFESALRINSRE